MRYLLDANACIGWLRQSQPKLVARIKQEQPTDIVICSVVVGELIYGAERSAAAHQANNRNRVEQLR
jgi:tRNA(fMet)-specific endonuclease VapC